MTDRRTVNWLGRALLASMVTGSLAACTAPSPPSTQPQSAPPPPMATPADERPFAAPAPAAPAPVEPAPKPEPSQPLNPPAKTAGEAAPTSLAIYMLSKGRGVPEPTRAAYQRIRALLEQQKAQSTVSDIAVKRIGIEGETRLCAQFRDRVQAQATLEEIRKISASVELLNVIEEPCPPTKGDTP